MYAYDLHYFEYALNSVKWCTVNLRVLVENLPPESYM